MLRYILWLLCPFVFLSTSVFAEERGDQILAEISERLRAMGSYESEIVVDIQDNSIEGHYRVSGDDYHINMGSVEFWGVGDRRYEVSHKIEEVVVERISGGDNMLLNNPSKAFDFVGQGFDVVEERAEGGVRLRLTPKVAGQAQIDVDEIIIYLDSEGLLPTKIIYEADNDRATVEFKGIKKSKGKMGSFDISKYKKYDIVDLY